LKTLFSTIAPYPAAAAAATIAAAAAVQLLADATWRPE